MLYPDSEKRIEGIRKTADFFAMRKCFETEKRIRTVERILEGDKVPDDFLKQLDSLFDTYQTEFVSLSSKGQDFRKRCFEELRETIINAIAKMKSNYAASQHLSNF